MYLYFLFTNSSAACLQTLGILNALGMERLSVMIQSSCNYCFLRGRGTCLPACKNTIKGCCHAMSRGGWCADLEVRSGSCPPAKTLHPQQEHRDFNCSTAEPSQWRSYKRTAGKPTFICGAKLSAMELFLNTCHVC